MTRKFTFLLFALLVTVVATQAQWQKTNGPEGGDVNSIRQVGNQIWMGTRMGLYISTNDGLSWAKSTLLEDKPVGDIYSEGDTIVIMYAESVTAGGDYVNVSTLTSFNGGNTWNNALMLSQGSFYFYKISRLQSALICLDEQTNNPRVSYDMGLSWNEPVLPPGYFNFSFAHDSQRVIISGMDDSTYTSHLFVSDDMMQTWEDRGNIEYGSFWYIKDSVILYNLFSDTLNNYLLKRSGDMGFTWDTVYYSPFPYQLSSFVNIGDSIYEYVYPGDPLVSSDNGLTWQPSVLPTNYFPNSISLANGNKLFYDYGTHSVMRYMASTGDIIPSQTGFKDQYIYAVRSCNNMLYASISDALFRTPDGGQSWSRVCQLPPGLANRQIYEIKNNHDTLIWANSNYFGISFNNGVSWDTIPVPGDYFIQDAASLAIMGNRIYLSTERFYFSDDWGLTFDTLTSLPGLSINDKTGFLEVHQNTLFAVNNSGFVYKFNPVTMAWTQVFSFWSTGAHNGNTLYSVDNALIVSGRRTFTYSLDDGTTWVTPTNNGLPLVSGSKAYPSRIQSYQGYWIGVVNSSAVYYTSDHGNNWQVLPGASSDFTIRSLVIQNGVLYTGSSYNSVWKRTGTLMSVSGKVYFDVNNNGQIDTGEDGIPQASVSTMPGGWMTVTDSVGSFTMITDINGDTIRPALSMGLIQINPPYRLASAGGLNQNFGIYCLPGIRDLNIDMTNVNVFRPGFSTLVNITIKNHGSVSQSPEVILVKPSNLIYLSADPMPLTVNGDTLTWHLGNLNFMEQAFIKLEVQTAFTTMVGDSISCSATVIPIIGDTVPSDNYFNLRRVVQGSFDPNDKTCEQGDYFPPFAIQQGHEMQFIIRFQNMGTMATEFVRIVDTLSPYLDPASFKIISSSHPVTWTMNPLRVVQFLFDPLALQPQSLDELGSIGYIKYSVKCMPGTTLGSTITNQAYIYFDYNPPVITNMTSTLVANNIITGETNDFPSESNIRFLLYPNPSSGNFRIRILDMRIGSYNVSMTDIAGRVLSVSRNSSAECSISLENYPDGIYLGNITSPSGEHIGSFKIVLSKP